MAEFLNHTFFGFDNAIFIFMNNLSQTSGRFLTPFFKFVTTFGDKGLFFIILSLIFALFSKTRKTGVTMLLAIGIGALLTNVIIKNAVARPRPYLNPIYQQYHASVGGIIESEFSFPSGHATVATSSMVALFLGFNKKWSWIGLVFAFTIGLSRIYLFVHYSTDVIVGFIVGTIAGASAHFILSALYRVMQNKSENKFCYHFVNFDLIKLLRKK
ncbi:MAG: phosphatase PAP2 family protein [Clostridia bacterium]|nr:phosphatase PAP2 family protein [Clostridia bacterium]